MDCIGLDILNPMRNLYIEPITFYLGMSTRFWWPRIAEDFQTMKMIRTDQRTNQYSFKQGRIHGHQWQTGGQGRKGAFSHFSTRWLRTDGPTDRRTDKASYRVACPQLKTRPDTRLPKSRAGGQGPYLRSLEHLGRSNKVQK